jgi:disulfide bond formation protein DsbB
MPPSFLSIRPALATIATLSLAGVALALFSQHALGMLPCAWCVLQRLIFIVIGVLAIMGLLIPSLVFKRVMLIEIVLASLAGIAAAWYQKSVAALSFSCDQTLADRIIVNSGLDANLPWLFGIYASCMDAAVSLLGLDYAIWSLLLFALLGVSAIAALIINRR